MSDPAPSSADEAKRRDASTPHAGRREILGGFALGLGMPLMLAVSIALTSGGGRAFRWENLGASMFLVAFPDAVVATILAIVPSTRRGGLGMLLGSGILLLLSLLTCRIR